MPEQPENLVLHRLDLIHRQNNRVLELMDRMSDDMRNVKVRLTGVEEGIAGTNRRLDRVEDRLDHIERRFDLNDAPEPSAPVPYRT